MIIIDRLKKKSIGYYIIFTILIVFAIIQIYPLIWLLFFSLKDNGEIFGGNVMGLPRQFLWSNYQVALTKGNVGRYFFNSFFVTTVVIVVSTFLAVSASYAIARMKWRLRNVAKIVFIMGLMVPLHAALLPLFLILTTIGIKNNYWALIIPYVAFALPMGVFVFTGFLQSLPKEMEESAFLDGCSIYRSFISIIFPLIKPAVATVAIFTYLSSWNELMFAVTFISKQEYKTLTVGILSMVGQYSTNWGPVGAGLVVATLPTIIIYILMSSQVQKSLITGAVKG